MAKPEKTSTRRGIGVDKNLHRKRAEQSENLGGSGGGDLHKFKVGQTLCYMMPPGREEDPTPFLEYETHYEVGPNKRMIVNLNNLRDNPVVADMVDSKFGWDDAEAGWDYLGNVIAKAGAKMKRQKAKKTALFCIVPLAYRKSSRYDWEDLAVGPVACRAGSQVYDGINDVMFDYDDITNPDGATLLIVTRKGEGMNTEYTVKADPDSTREPYVVDDKLWEKVETALEPDGKCDLYKILVNWVRSDDDIRAVIAGQDGGSEEDEEDEPPRRRATASRGSRSRKAPEPDEDDEDDEDEEGEEDEPPARSRRKAAPVEDEDEDEEDDDDADELEAVLKKRKARRAR
jgi:hypothetical protein